MKWNGYRFARKAILWAGGAAFLAQGFAVAQPPGTGATLEPGARSGPPAGPPAKIEPKITQIQEPVPNGKKAVEQPTPADPYGDSLLLGGCGACGEHGDCCLDPQYPAIGTKRNPFAPFEIDHATPGAYLAIRLVDVNDWHKPDRAEYLWARQGGRGPAIPERQVDYQDIRFYYENGAGPISFFTDLPLRFIDPELNPNTGGLGDMNVGIKTTLKERDHYRISSIFRTYIPTGSARKGLGSGHVSLEPGVLGMFKLTDCTLLHGEFKYWIPIGGDSNHKGQIIRWGLGVSQVLYEDPCNEFAIIPTFEFLGWDVLDGRATLANGAVEEIDGLGIFNAAPGLRIEFGQFDIGFFTAFSISDDEWYETMFRFDFRCFF